MISIGISGWSYQHWQDCFYTGVTRKDRLKCYAERFSAVEVNGTSYRLQSPPHLKNVFNETPATFRFAIKANRYLTHNKKLLQAGRGMLPRPKSFRSC